MLGGGLIRRKKGNKSGVLIAAFGVGLMLAFFLPVRWLVVILAATVIILGLAQAKNHC